MVVDVSVNAEQSPEDVLHFDLKVRRERDIDSGRENFLIIELVLNPTHQTVNVLRSRDLDGLLDLDTISPVIFVP